ncbi:pikachurin-like [Salvelinus fontinalis]|uniref:pikachurin-like n=1 Tax=Salvelinus fontinalis TaxID=8038 RepID=UPI00248694BD|nr:pikachurin-like [Salvelinus fontinalis]
MHLGAKERLHPPLDIELETINCTAVRVKWWIPWRHISTVTGYKVFYTEMRNGRPASSAVAVNVRLSLDMLATVKFNGHTIFDVEVGSLKMAAQYVFSVGAYGWAGEGRPSVPRRVSTFQPEMCMPPSAPSQPAVGAVSDTETELSWKQSERKGSSPVLHFIVFYIRPELDSEWTSLKDPVNSSSVVVRGLDPDTQYHFAVQAVNVYGASPHSAITDPIWTFSVQEGGSGSLGQGSPGNGYINQEDLTDVKNSDYGALIQEPLFSPEEDRRSLPRSRTWSPISHTGGGGMSPRENTADSGTIITANKAATIISTSTTPIPANHTLTTNPVALTSSPGLDSILPTPSSAPIPAHSTLAVPFSPTPPGPRSQWNGQVRELYDLACEDAVCSLNSVCIDDYQSGGSRCYCALGRGGDACSQVVVVKYPQFYGFSHVAFEPLKNSYQSFQIMLEFKTDSENGLLLFCGENEHGSGDFTSLALIHGKLHFRFNCGTGTAQIVSGSRVALDQWHSVVVGREGAIGWLRLDNDTPVTGHAQGDYNKITFRTPLYVGGSPNAYWLARTAGTNRGFQGCIQTLSINSRVTDMRPWPMGWALSGADVGECSASVCEGVTCANEGTCFASHADGYICLCALGYRGPLCQESFQLVAPYFNASVLSYASALWPRSSRHYLSWMEFEVTFRPTAPDGILLYSQDSASRDFLSISLLGGYLEFSFDCGSGTATTRSEETLTMNAWHQLRVSRTGREGILQVDNQMPTHSLGEGAFTQIRCSGPLYIGGVPEHTNPRSKINAGAALLHHFTGSIQKITLNERSIRLPQDFSEGVNIDNSLHPCVDSPCANRGTCRPKQALYECDCPLGYTGKHCLQVTEATETPQFIGRSYLVYNNKDILKRVSGCRTHVLLRFRSSAQDGLLLWRGHTPVRANSDFVSLGLEDGALIFSYNLGSGVAIVMINGTFSDGQWHRVKAIRDGQYGSLTVDHYETSTGRSPGNMRQLNTNSMVYLGGMKEVGLYNHGQYLWGLVGCISQLTLSTDYHLSLVGDAAAGKNINTCRP